jgi:hypothetical protein
VLEVVGLKSIGLPARSPNLNDFAERFVKNINGFCLDCLILIGMFSLHCACSQFVLHYLNERTIRDWRTRSPSQSSTCSRPREPSLRGVLLSARVRAVPAGELHARSVGIAGCRPTQGLGQYPSLGMELPEPIAKSSAPLIPHRVSSPGSSLSGQGKLSFGCSDQRIHHRDPSRSNASCPSPINPAPGACRRDRDCQLPAPIRALPLVSELQDPVQVA